MAVTWNFNTVDLERRAAAKILLAANHYLNQLQARLNIPNSGVRVRRQRNTVGGRKGSQYTIYPNTSRPGEYPRKATGTGAANLLYEPTTIEGVIAAGLKVRIGVKTGGKHLAILELFKGRLGFQKAAEELDAQVKAILES